MKTILSAVSRLPVWLTTLSMPHQKAYLKTHPDSRYAHLLEPLLAKTPAHGGKPKSRGITHEVVKLSTRAAADWYAANKIRSNSWAFGKSDVYAFYGVKVGEDIVAVMGFSNAGFTTKCNFDKYSWPDVLNLFNRPTTQPLHSSTGLPHRLPYITGLQVGNKFQGKGYAKVLLKLAVSLAKKQGKPLLFLSSVSGSTAYKIYEKFGFTELCKSSLGRAERIMTLPL